MSLAFEHSFQVLTKRPQRLLQLMESDDFKVNVRQIQDDYIFLHGLDIAPVSEWPIPNVWLGTSVESQAYAWRIDFLAKTPAAVRFLSIEPMIGPVDLNPWLWRELDTFTIDGFTHPDDAFGPAYERRGDVHWVITGGESGPNHRPIDPAWAMAVRDQCLAAGVAYFHKQNGGRTPKAGGRLLEGREWNQFPKT